MVYSTETGRNVTVKHLSGKSNPCGFSDSQVFVAMTFTRGNSVSSLCHYRIILLVMEKCSNAGSAFQISCYNTLMRRMKASSSLRTVNVSLSICLKSSLYSRFELPNILYTSYILPRQQMSHSASADVSAVIHLPVAIKQNMRLNMEFQFEKAGNGGKK